MNFFVMKCVGPVPIAAITEGPDLPGGSWNNGRRLEISVPTPLTYTLKRGASDRLKALYAAEPVPLIRKDLLAVLRSAGVDNLEVFPAVIRGDNGREHTDHLAFNIVGLIAAADFQASTLMGTTPPRLIDTDFDSLVIDAEKAGAHKLFRLAESVNAIVVNEDVRSAIDASGIVGMKFYGPGEWTG
jgi:hypothetical protein